MNELVKAFEFQGNLLVFRRDDSGRFFTTEVDLAKRLMVTPQAVAYIRKNHPTEFEEGWIVKARAAVTSRKVALGDHRKPLQWLYSPEAVAIVAMHAVRSPVGSEFRTFAAKMLTKFYAGELYSELQAQNVQLKSEVSFLRSQIARVQDMLVGLKQGWATTGRLLRVVGGMFLQAVTPDEHARLVDNAKRQAEERRAKALRRRIVARSQRDLFENHKA